MQPKTFIKSLHTLSKLSDVDDTSTSDKIGALPENPQSIGEQSLNIHPDYVTGFSDAESCFFYSIYIQ